MPHGVVYSAHHYLCGQTADPEHTDGNPHPKNQAMDQEVLWQERKPAGLKAQTLGERLHTGGTGTSGPV